MSTFLGGVIKGVLVYGLSVAAGLAAIFLLALTFS